MTAILTRPTRAGVVDMVAVSRFVYGDPVHLNPVERVVAIHAARGAGQSIRAIAERLRTRDDLVKADLEKPLPVDVFGDPIHLNV